MADKVPESLAYYFNDIRTVDIYTQVKRYTQGADNFNDSTSTQIEFNIPEDNFSMTHPTFFFGARVQIVDKDGKILPDKTPIAPVNFLATQLASDITLKVSEIF